MDAARGEFFERCPLAAAVVGRDGAITAANAAWEGLLGWSSEELEGRPLRLLLDPADGARAARPGGLVGTWSARCVRPDGSVRRLVWSVAAAPDGSHLCVARAPEDEETRRQERFRAEFINLAAHALNTPLTPMQLALDTLAVQAANAQDVRTRQTVAVARRNFERLRDVVAELLDTARLQAGRLPLELRDGDLSALVVEVVEAQRATAAEAGVALGVRVEPGLRAEVDAERLRHALRACLACAIALAPQGSEVRVAATGLPDAVAVAATVPEASLTAQQRASLFHLFAPHDDEAPQPSGTGLGLYMARGIVELHGGQAEAIGGPGVGVTLRLLLPRNGPAATRPPAATASTLVADGRPRGTA